MSNISEAIVAGAGGEAEMPIMRDRRLLGRVFLGLGSVVILVMLVVVTLVTYRLTEPAPGYEHVIKTLSSQVTDKDKYDNNTVRLLITLEYANADIRTAGIQIAFGLIAGFFFTIVSMLMFAAAFGGVFEGEARSLGSQVTVRSAAPGVLAMLVGGVLIGFGVAKDVGRPIKAEFRDAEGIDVWTRSVAPPRSGQGESAKDGANDHSEKGDSDGVPADPTDP